MPISVNLSLKKLINMGFMPSLDPPKSPLRRGTLIHFRFPPTIRGARSDLDLIVKQQSLTGFELKLTPMGIAVS